METKYKCEKCGSESKGVPGTCCGGERKACDTCNVGNKDLKIEHNHKECETCPVCSAK